MEEQPVPDSADTPATPDTILTGELVWDKKPVTVSLKDGILTWTPLAAWGSGIAVPLCDVIACHKGRVSSKCTTKKLSSDVTDQYMTLHYVQKKKSIWSHKHQIFESKDATADKIVSAVTEKCKIGRPKRLVVIINPIGGRKKGEATYASTVAPLLQLAQVDADVIVSNSSGHVEEVGKTYDFSTVDGIMILGGDGTFQELMHTLLPRVQREAGVDIDDPEAKMVPLPWPIGMVPTGTGNGIARAFYGEREVPTAVLNIITGRRVKAEMMTLRVRGKFGSSAGLMLGCGSWSDSFLMMKETRMRSLFGRVAPFIRIFTKKRREFFLKLDYLPVETSPGTVASSADDTVESKMDWQSVEGHYTGFLAFIGYMEAEREGETLHVTRDRPGAMLLLERQCGQWQFLKYLIKVATLKPDALKADFVKVASVRHIRFQILHREEDEVTPRDIELDHYVSCDGEPRATEHTEGDIRFDTILEVFGTRYETREK